jgi:MraZ protein
LFTGTFTHSLDDKGRLTLPKDFRAQLGSGAWLGPGNDGCLCIWPEEEWRKVAEGVKAMMRDADPQARAAARLFPAQSHQVTPDAQGRIPIPADLRAGKKIEKDVVVIGVYDWLEIWPVGRFQDEVLSPGSAAIDGGRIASFGVTNP